MKRCACGAEYDAQGWAALPLVTSHHAPSGEVDDGVEVLQFRRCMCGSTLAIARERDMTRDELNLKLAKLLDPDTGADVATAAADAIRNAFAALSALPEDVARDVRLMLLRPCDWAPNQAVCGGTYERNCESCQAAERIRRALATAAARVPGLEADMTRLLREAEGAPASQEPWHDETAARVSLAIDDLHAWKTTAANNASERDAARKEAEKERASANERNTRLSMADEKALRERVATLERERDDAHENARHATDCFKEAVARAGAAERRARELEDACEVAITSGNLKSPPAPAGLLEAVGKIRPWLLAVTADYPDVVHPGTVLYRRPPGLLLLGDIRDVLAAYDAAKGCGPCSDGECNTHPHNDLGDAAKGGETREVVPSFLKATVERVVSEVAKEAITEANARRDNPPTNNMDVSANALQAEHASGVADGAARVWQRLMSDTPPSGPGGGEDAGGRAECSTDGHCTRHALGGDAGATCSPSRPDGVETKEPEHAGREYLKAHGVDPDELMQRMRSFTDNIRASLPPSSPYYKPRRPEPTPDVPELKLDWDAIKREREEWDRKVAAGMPRCGYGNEGGPCRTAPESNGWCKYHQHMATPDTPAMKAPASAYVKEGGCDVCDFQEAGRLHKWHCAFRDLSHYEDSDGMEVHTQPTPAASEVVWEDDTARVVLNGDEVVIVSMDDSGRDHGDKWLRSVLDDVARALTEAKRELSASIDETASVTAERDTWLERCRKARAQRDAATERASKNGAKALRAAEDMRERCAKALEEQWIARDAGDEKLRDSLASHLRGLPVEVKP